MPLYEFIQLVKVIVPNEWDGDEFGNEWQVHYVLYRTYNEEGNRCYELYLDDGKGNGNLICRGTNEAEMRRLTLRLGEFVEWTNKEKELI